MYYTHYTHNHSKLHLNTFDSFLCSNVLEPIFKCFIYCIYIIAHLPLLS